MKKVDRLLISSYVPPFIVTFAIAMFVLLMQILWVYLDDIAGKGLGFFLVIELLAYKCVGLVPMALPLAVLISSVMVMGGLAEHYELSSIKSAGVSLLRTMLPIIVFGMGATALSYYCSNHLIPVANLKFGSRMFDIQQKKATLNLEAGVFNDDFTNYAIRIGSKASDDRTIYDVLVYDHREATSGELSEIVAESGEMFASPDGGFFVMNLRNGNQYMESRPTNRGSERRGFPFIRTSFDSWTKVFDLSEFQLARTNEELFSQNKSMMSTSQLALAADSIGTDVLRRRKNLANHVANYLTLMPQDSTFLFEQEQPEEYHKYGKPQISELDSINIYRQIASNNYNSSDEQEEEEEEIPPGAQPYRPAPDTVGIAPDAVALTPDTQAVASPRELAAKKPKGKPQLLPGLDKAVAKSRADSLARRRAVAQTIPDSDSPFADVPDRITDFDAFLRGMPAHLRSRVFTKARSFVRSISSQAESASRSLDRMLENRVKYIYEQHTKYSMAVVCIIFVFIGAPMGAIVRKGGFGYPILVSIIFFMLFVVLTIFCRKIAETHKLPAAVAAWLPCLVLMPIGIWLTIKAMNDSKLFSFDRIGAWWSRLRRKREELAEARAGAVD